MKLYKIIIVILCIILISIIFFLIYNSNIILKDEVNSTNNTNTIVYTDKQKEILNNISMTIEDNSLTPTSASIIIKDNNKYNNENEGFLFDKWFRIDKYINGEWKSLQGTFGSYYCEEIAYKVYPKIGILKMNIEWESAYGRLENGEYRIVKEIEGIGYYYIEFTIE